MIILYSLQSCGINIMNTLKLPNLWKKVSLFESTSFNNNVTKKFTEYIKQYQTIFLLLLTTTSLQKKRVMLYMHKDP